MSSAKDKGARLSALKNDSPGIRKIHSRHTWVKSDSHIYKHFIYLSTNYLQKLENISHGKGQPVARKAVQYVQDEVARRKEKFHCMFLF